MDQPQAVQVPLTWQLSYGRDPQTGQSVCQVHLTQAGMAFTLLMDADSLERFATSCAATAKQARSGLIVATPGMTAAPPAPGQPNGHPLPG
jgi:hypothetical protein